MSDGRIRVRPRVFPPVTSEQLPFHEERMQDVANFERWVGEKLDNFRRNSEALGQKVGEFSDTVRGIDDSGLRSEAATQAENAAEAERQADEDAAATASSQCVGCERPECKEAADKAKNALYQNKRLKNDGDFHGYLNRMIEQMCGAAAFGSKGWENHISDLVGAQRRLKDAMIEFDKEKCSPAASFGRKERKVIDKIVGRRGARGMRSSGGWGPNGISYKGRAHPDCANFRDVIKSGNLDRMLGVIRPGIF